MKKFLIFLMALTLTGCSFFRNITTEQAKHFAVNTSQIAMTLMNLDYGIQEARSVIVANKDKFSDEDWAKLVEVSKKIDAIRTELGEIMGGEITVQKVVVNIAQFEGMVDRVKSIYFTLDGVIEKNFDSFSEDDKFLILKAKNQLLTLHGSFLNLKNSPPGADGTDTVKQVIQIGTILTSILKILAPLLVV
jgi:hypothetical protein